MADKKEVVAVRATMPPHDGDMTHWTFSPKELPNGLRQPMAFDGDAYDVRAALAARAASPEVAKLVVDTNFTSGIYDAAAYRWQMVHEHYGTADTPDGWKWLAIQLANEFIPGVRISMEQRSEELFKAQSRIIRLVYYAAEIKQRMEASGEHGAARLFDKTLVGELWQNWPADLGDRPLTEGALRKEFSLAKEGYDELKMRLAPHLKSLRELGFSHPKGDGPQNLSECPQTITGNYRGRGNG